MQDFPDGYQATNVEYLIPYSGSNLCEGNNDQTHARCDNRNTWTRETGDGISTVLFKLLNHTGRQPRLSFLFTVQGPTREDL